MLAAASGDGAYAAMIEEPKQPVARKRLWAVWVALACIVAVSVACALVAWKMIGLQDEISEYWAAVAGQGAVFTSPGKVREYFIQAETVEWNYAPSGLNNITGKAFSVKDARIYTERVPGRIGTKYWKCRYRGYTSADFTTRLPVPDEDTYLGIQGPVIRAEVGDTVRVLYRNKCNFVSTIHTHGVRYTKPNEGAPYADGTVDIAKADDMVGPEMTVLYNWEIPEQAGPGPSDGSSVMWMYHSHADEVADTSAGLIGSLVITRRGMAKPDGSPKDVDRELFLLWNVIDENESSFLPQNILDYSPDQKPLLVPDEPVDLAFQESNLMHSINGYIYGSGRRISLCNGQRVRWYNMAMGSERDLHTPHWHGNVVMVMGQRMDVIDLLPAQMVVADMVPYNDGIWLLHCHVNDHIKAGMVTMYEVNTC